LLPLEELALRAALLPRVGLRAPQERALELPGPEPQRAARPVPVLPVHAAGRQPEEQRAAVVHEPTLRRNRLARQLQRQSTSSS
jgi:hypothetical protein